MLQCVWQLIEVTCFGLTMHHVTQNPNIVRLVKKSSNLNHRWRCNKSALHQLVWMKAQALMRDHFEACVVPIKVKLVDLSTFSQKVKCDKQWITRHSKLLLNCSPRTAVCHHLSEHCWWCRYEGVVDSSATCVPTINIPSCRRWAFIRRICVCVSVCVAEQQIVTGDRGGERKAGCYCQGEVMEGTLWYMDSCDL